MAKAENIKSEATGGEKQSEPKPTWTPASYRKAQHTGLADGAPDQSRIETKTKK
jgi:hypothetical protein